MIYMIISNRNPNPNTSEHRMRTAKIQETNIPILWAKNTIPYMLQTGIKTQICR